MSGEGEVRARPGGGTGAEWRKAARRSARRPPCAILAAMVLAAAGAPPARADPQPEPPSAAGVANPDPQRLSEGQVWPVLWTPETRRQMAAVLDGAVRHGLDAAPVVVALRNNVETAPDAALSQAALRYARALASGAANPDKLHAVFELRRNEVDLVAGLSVALAVGGLAEWFDSLAPATEEYRALSDAYVAARARAAALSSPSVAEGPPLSPGARDPRILAIARRLVDEGYLDQLPPRPKGKGKGKARPPRVYSPDMVEAVKRLQLDNGLRPDGVVAKATLLALNGGPRLRARTLAVNLERLRWLARDPPPTRIDVNIATAQLTVYQDGVAADRRRVIVGARGHETPPIEASFSRIVVNPPWYVPETIARREILPKGRGYLARQGMVLRAGRVIQKPGPESALGQVKFDLQDDHAIYLHDTPTKALFGRAGRHLSHGCVRVEDAVGLAESLAGAAGRLVELQDALAASATRTVDLGAEVPVRLLYQTAYVEAGAVRLAPDAYGWDDDVAPALGLGTGGPRKPPEGSADEGP